MTFPQTSKSGLEYEVGVVVGEVWPLWLHLYPISRLHLSSISLLHLSSISLLHLYSISLLLSLFLLFNSSTFDLTLDSVDFTLDDDKTSIGDALTSLTPSLCHLSTAISTAISISTALYSSLYSFFSTLPLLDLPLSCCHDKKKSIGTLLTSAIPPSGWQSQYKRLQSWLQSQLND